MRSLLVCTFLFSAASFSTVAEAKDRCLPIKARLQSTFGACPKDFDSPVGLCSTGKLTGWFGTATTRFRVLNASYSADLRRPERAKTLSYTGDLEITDEHGTILLKEVGLSDTANKIFNELSRVSSAEGRYVGMVGRLFISGTVSKNGRTLNADVKGKLCG
jgi:hypothetical protein